MADNESETVERARVQVSKMRKRIREAIEAGRTYDAKDLARKLFRSHAVKVVACHEALASRSAYERGRLPSLDTLVSRIGDFEGDDQAVRVIRQPKGGGRFRDTFDYAVLDRARQQWVKLSVELLTRPHPNQSGVTGSGPAAIMDRIRELVKSGTYRYAAEFDIKNCFQSIQNVDAIRAEWNLPNWAIQKIVTLKEKEDKGLIIDRKGRAPTSSSSSMGTLTTRGLPQGASTSPLFAYSLNRPVLEALEREHGHEAVVFNHCDNFLVLGISREAVERTHRTLTTLLAEQPVGPLALHIKTAPTPLGRGITFLGYRIKKSAGSTIIGITAERKARFLQEVRAHLNSARGVAEGRGRNVHLEALRQQVVGWVSSFSAAPNDLVTIIRTLDHLFICMKENATVGATMHQLARKVPTQSALDANLLPPSAPSRPRTVQVMRWASDILDAPPRGFSIRQAKRNITLWWEARNRAAA